MRNKILILITILVAGTLLSACGPTNVYPQAQPIQRTMNVTGTGMITLTPDIAYIYIGVHTEDASASVAVKNNSTKTQAVIDAIKSFGVAEKDIQTTNFSVYPNQKYDNQGNPTELVYSVDNTVYVTMHDLTKIGDLLDKTTQAGANTVNGITFDIENKEEALSRARTLAIENAKKQADEVAKAANVTLGDVLTISFYDSTPNYYPVGKGGGGMVADGVSVPISAGQLQISVTATVMYELK
jgi:uncharacterized protein